MDTIKNLYVKPIPYYIPFVNFNFQEATNRKLYSWYGYFSLMISYYAIILLMKEIILLKLLWKFHKDPISHSTFPPCLMEYMEVCCQTWRRCHMTCINHLKLLQYYHQNLRSGRLYLSSKSLSGVFEDRMTGRCYMTCINPLKLMWKFHPNSKSVTLSRLYMSSKSLPGVLEDMEVPNETENCVWS